MAARTCGYCGRDVHLAAQMSTTEQRPGVTLIRAVVECDHCHELSVASHWSYGLYNDSLETVAAQFEQGEGTWVPEHVAGKTFEEVPKHINSLADEAYRCASIKARRGAILVARSALEATAKDKGFTKGNLLDKIDAMVTDDVLEKRIGNAAHAVRGLGADMAHGDVTIDVEDDDVDDSLEIMSAVLENVYQLPARVSGVLARRAARKAAMRAAANAAEEQPEGQ